LVSDVRIFTSFDPEHDDDLQELLREQSSKPSSGFEISACSRSGEQNDRWGERVRREIRDADEVIVICGEHSEESLPMSEELRIAREEHKPYFLLWGRRETMCTKPAGAKPTDGMYSWTWDILRSQITATLRNARPREIPANCRRVTSASPRG
jgi:hypothetical protein